MTSLSACTARRLLLAAALATSVFGAACSSSDSASGGGECKTGANAPYATPAGTPFSLPQGIAVKDEISGLIDGGPCENASTVEYGGDLLSVCLVLENTTGAEAKVTLPAGLTFIPADPATQNGIMLQEHELTVPIGTKAFRINLYCMNEHCSYGKSTDRFTFGNVTNDPALVELIGLARGRKMDRSAIYTAQVFGAAIWDITGGKGLTEARKQEIASTPDGT